MVATTSLTDAGELQNRIRFFCFCAFLNDFTQNIGTGNVDI